MIFKDKLLLISGFILFISFIATLIFRSIAFLLFGIIMCLFLFYIYLYDNEVKTKIKEKLDNQHRDIIKNKVCVKPTKDNPFMNPNILEVSNLDYSACDINNKRIKNGIDDYFKTPVYKDVIDIYDRKFSERQFYTMPATTIPNDQESYVNWLYSRGKSCKENNGEQCYYNIM
jgi:hypothetical protein